MERRERRHVKKSFLKWIYREKIQRKLEGWHDFHFFMSVLINLIQLKHSILVQKLEYILEERLSMQALYY